MRTDEQKEVERSVKVFVDYLRTFDYLAQTDNKTLFAQADWAVRQGMTGTQYLRVIYYLGADRMGRLSDQELMIIGAITGRKNVIGAFCDDIPF